MKSHLGACNALSQSTKLEKKLLETRVPKALRLQQEM